MNGKFSQAADLSTSLNNAYQKLLSQQPAPPPDVTDPAVQSAYRTQAMRTQSQQGRSSTFMNSNLAGGNGKSFLGG